MSDFEDDVYECPERIWIEQDDCPYFYEESELEEVGSPVTEYIRADLCDELEADNKRLREALEWIAAPAIFFLSRKDAIEMRDTARTALDRNAGGNDAE